MPLFKLKKTMLLGSAIAAAAALTACGGGGGGSSSGGGDNTVSLCDSNFTDGASELILTSFEGGVLTGRVDDGSSLKSLNVKVRGEGESVRDATLSEDCRSFSVDVPALAVRSAVEPIDDKFPDYTITAVNNVDQTTTQEFLASGSHLQNVGALQLNSTAFNGPQGSTGKGMTDWLSEVLVDLDIPALLDERGYVYDPRQGGAFTESQVDPVVTGAPELLSRRVALTPSELRLFMAAVLDDTVVQEKDGYLMYIRGATFPASELSINVVSSGNDSADNAFDVEVELLFPGETVLKTELLAVDGILSTSGNGTSVNLSQYEGALRADFVVPNARLKIRATAKTDGENIVSLTVKEPNYVLDNNGVPTSEVALSNAITFSSSALGGTIVSRVDNTVCENICGSGVTTYDGSVLIGNIASISPAKLVGVAAETLIGEGIRAVMNGLSIPALSTQIALDGEALETSTMKAIAEAKSGVIDEAGDNVHGGFVGLSGRVALSDDTTPIKTGLGSYMESGAAAIITDADLGDDSGVALALSETVLNQVLFAGFQADSAASQVVTMTAGDIDSGIEAATLGAIKATDPVEIRVAIDTTPYINVGSQSSDVTVALNGATITVGLGSQLTSNVVQDALIATLDAKGTMTYGINAATGLPEASMLPSAFTMNIKTVQVKAPYTAISEQQARELLGASLPQQISTILENMGNTLTSLVNDKQNIIYNNLTGSDAMITNTLPKAAGLQLNAVSSDASGKYLLLKGDLVVEDDLDGNGVEAAIFNFVFCDSADPAQKNFCPVVTP